jgi:hypothetical protein
MQQPHVKPKPEKVATQNTTIKLGGWPEHARVQKGGAEKQHVYIQSIIHHANQHETFKVLTQEAWPDLTDRKGYCLTILLQAAKQLRASEPQQTADFVSRARQDYDFCKTLGAIVSVKFSVANQGNI